MKVKVLCLSVMSNSLWSPWTVAPRFLCSRDSSGKNTGVGSYSLLQGVFPTQGWNPGLPHCRQIIYHLDSVDHNKLWKILKKLGIPGHLPCLLRSLHARQEKTIRHGQMDWFKIGKGAHQGYILSPCLFNFYAEYSMRNAGLEEAQAGIKIARRNISNS